MATLIPALGTCLSRMTAGERRLHKQFSFKSVGIQVQGSATVLKINCRNARQILRTASLIAVDLHNAARPAPKGPSSFNPIEDARKVLTMYASEGLEFPMLALIGVRQMPTAGEDERDETRLLYVASTRGSRASTVTS